MTPTPPKRPSASRPVLASELVQDILKTKVEEKKQQAQSEVARRRDRLRKVNYFLLIPLFLALLAWNVLRSDKPPEVFTRAEVDASVRFKVYLAVQALKAYRDSAGVWPTSLEVVGFANEGLTYQRVDTTFQISAATNDSPFTYRYGDDLAFYRDAAQSLMR